MTCFHLLVLLFGVLYVQEVECSFPMNFDVFLRDGAKNVIKNDWYVKTKYTTRCSFWKWGRCTRYRSDYKFSLHCKTGWQNYVDDFGACNHAICDGLISAYNGGACNIYYPNDQIMYRTEQVVKSSGGTCVDRETCSGCNDGFYADGNKCRICPGISNCHHRKCSYTGDNTCVYCHGEVKPKPYWRAYTPALDGGKTCRKACSWRSDSTRCFPGHCSDETVGSCKCVQGFEGHHCEKIKDKPEILYNLMKLEDGSQVEMNPEDTGVYNHPMPVVWTNKVKMFRATVDFRGKYGIPEEPSPKPSSDGSSHYITHWEKGVIGGSVYLRLFRGGSVYRTLQKTDCPGSWENPIPENNNYQCEGTFDLGLFGTDIRHNDILEFEINERNGGYVEVMNREHPSNLKSKYQLVGKTETRLFRYHFDTDPPYQSCARSGGTGCTQPVTAPDLTKDPNVLFSWSGWVDDLSNLKGYSYQVFDLKHDGVELWEHLKVDDGALSLSETSTSFVLAEPGMYSLLFIATDNAGNNKVARKLILFDNKSEVTKRSGTKSLVATASAETNHEWVVKDTGTVQFEFIDRFQNIRHKNNRWLNSVRKYADVENNYDDKYGKRTTQRIDNIHAIVDFKVSFQVNSSKTSIKDNRLLTSIPDIHKQAETLSVNWADGDRMDCTVRAIDVMDEYSEETVTVYRDATPPVIENLWLTRGKRKDIYVHNIEEFTEMTIEWDAYDYHSGIDSLYWKLYDNFTEAVVQHGHEDLIAQGNTNDLSACQAAYGSEPGHCYCTPFKGCFHKHFTVKPEIKAGAGLIVGKDRGVHDYDYYIEVQVTNIAQLKSTHIKKITIDTSPPHTGVVHDGVNGTLEVDYQQSKILHAYWDGFFDRESGILMYLYTFKTSCQDASKMVLDSGDSDIVETTSRHTTHTVSAEGTYYVTVVAFNRALEPSIPVCSDGVTVDTSTPSVKEVVLEHARIRGGLVTDSGKSNVWILGNDRIRRQVDNVTTECWSKAAILEDIDMYRIQRDKNDAPVLVDGNLICENASSSPVPIKNVVPKSSMMFLEWIPVNKQGGIFDYEVGISKTALGGSAPDIVGFVSTKQHAHMTIKHADLPDGTEFFFHIKTISKSEVEGIQAIGPCIMDTTAPDHTGDISVSLSGDFLVASWTSGDFLDSEDYYNLTYYFAIGHEKFGTDIQNYQTLREGGSCIMLTPPSCTAASLLELDWQLHGHHTYYITVMAENTVGLFTRATSQPYTHDVQLASKGIVLDVAVGMFTNETNIPYMDVEDKDFQTETDRLACRWSGFVHPYLDVSYRVHIGTISGGSDILSATPVGTDTFYEKSGLSLSVLQTYYFTVEAVTSAGSVKVTSDGVTIVQNSYVLNNINVYDGKPCHMIVDNGKLFKHHDEDNRLRCEQDADYQASQNSLHAYWTIPDNMKYYTPDVFWAVEIRSDIGNLWTTLQDYQYISSGFEAEAHDFKLLPGRKYRSAVKICASETCFTPLHSDGVMILANPPQKGSISLNHLNTTQTGGKEKIKVKLTRFFDPDISSMTERYEAIDKYEWAITDNSVTGKIYTKWTSIKEGQVIVDGADMRFEIALNGTMDFSRCKRFSVRGYNKAKLWSVVSADVKSCAAFDPRLIVPNDIIDAFGDPEFDTDGSFKDGYGKPISLPLNDRWNKEDVDYTPYMNLISAVWPDLRHDNYKYAVLRADPLDVTTYYLSSNRLSLPDPCSHADALPGSCGNTDKEFVNIQFPAGLLVHGKRYMVCIHAPKTELKHETGSQLLPETNICSDGVVVDLSPGKAGNVWIGNIPGTIYQTTRTHMYVNWETFIDIEDFITNSHASGIKSYTVGVGTSPGGNDVVAFHDVGAINHIAFHNLELQSGHAYYAMVTVIANNCHRLLNGTKNEMILALNVKYGTSDSLSTFTSLFGEDFAGRTTSKTSDPIIVDTTPPVKTDKPIHITGRHLTSKTEISACWTDVFMDAESGIHYYVWSVGSRPGYDNVMKYVNVSDVDCGVSDPNSPLDLHEGHAYFINVRAYNGAGFYTQASSWAYVVDLSPPIAGHVYDGKKDKNPAHKKDTDFQTDTSFIAAFWEGFHDAHTTIKEYKVSVGTCKQCENILQDQPIGITQEFVLPLKQLGVGLTYYTTVTACNTADLCTSVTSDGIILDNSPPSPGIVQDGTGKLDTHFQAERTYIGAKWFGFTDPQSGLDKYEWWAGTSPGGADVIGKTKLHLAETATNPKVAPLPLDKTIYVTVRAYNKAGLHSQTTSNGFTIDTTPPSVTPPVLSRDVGSLMPNSIVYRTSFKVSWTAIDKETSIQRQYVSLKAHRGGEFQMASTQVSGIVRDYMFTALDLNDGVNYYVNLVSCNGAGLCSNAESSAIFVDSSPPSRGMFAIKTNHAASLPRDVPDFMVWTSRAVYLSWLGFADLHSKVDYYMISIGSSYMDNDLNKNSRAAVKVSHSEKGDVYDEGYVQTAKIETEDLNNKKITDGLFISMWAVNSVGLSSPLIHFNFKKIPGGSLELLRRCSAYSCKGHCVCAPQDQLCPSSAVCHDKTGDSKQSQIQVMDILDLKTTAERQDMRYTPTDMCLSGSWAISLYGELPPKWYEWSVGFEAVALPEGIFHQADERVWHDAGQNVFKVFTLPKGKSLLDDVKYSFFVRVWYTSDTFAVFKSDGITINRGTSKGTSVRKVTEFNLDAVNKNDMDYIRYYPFAVSWKNKFLDAEKRLDKIKLYLSSYPGGHDVYELAKEFKASDGITSYNFMRFNMDPHTKFYSNVVAFSNTGGHYTEWSDGFQIDISNPHSGLVYDGSGLHDVEYQSDVNTVAASWHGFVDLDAGVKTYQWCVGLTDAVSECGVQPWKAVGLTTSAVSNVTTPFSQGNTIYNKIYAIDNVGHVSKTIVSDGIKIDTTPPVSQTMVHEEDLNLAKNPSFENSAGNEVSWKDLFSTDICSLDISYHPLNWERSRKTCTAVVSSNTNLAKAGRTMVIVRGSLKQTVENLESDGFYKITFVTSHLPVEESVMANKEGFIEFGDKRYVFLLYTKSYRHDDHRKETRKIISWHFHTFFFHAASAKETLTLGSLDMKTGMLIDDVKVHRVTLNQTESDNVQSHVVFLHDWGSIHGSWSFIEDESDIVDYQWGIGYTKGGTQIQQFVSVGLRKFDYNSKVTLVHKSNITVTVIATNSAGLKAIAYSPPILVDLTEPDISEVNDGTELDLDSWVQDEILVNWKVEDPESGIRFCEWAIGIQPLGNEIQTFTKMPYGVTRGTLKDVGYNTVEGKTIYNTIRCQNNAGLDFTKSSDGVKISKKAPNITNVQFTVAGLSSTQYKVKPGFQSRTDQVRLMWTGFIDFIGMEGYVFTIKGSGTPLFWRKILSYDQMYTYVRLDKLSMTQGVQELTLKAVNLQQKSSQEVHNNFTVLLKAPSIFASKNIISTWDNANKKFTVSWDNVFSSDNSLYYEVSAGTVVGGADVVQWIETTNTFVTFSLPPTVKEPANRKVFIIVRAISASGLSENKSGSITLPANA